MPHYKKLLEVEQISDVHNRIFNAWNYYAAMKEEILKIINSEYRSGMEYEQYFFDEYETFFRKMSIVPERAAKSHASYKRLLRQFIFWNVTLKENLNKKLSEIDQKYKENVQKYYLDIKDQILKIVNSEYGWDMADSKNSFFNEYETYFENIKAASEIEGNSQPSYKKLLDQYSSWNGSLKKKLKRKLIELSKKYNDRLEKDKQLIAAQRTELIEINDADEKYFQWYLMQNKPPKMVYRGDGRNITENFLDNFKFEPILPGGTKDISFYGVVEHTHTSSRKNGMVSTTTDRNEAKKWATDGHLHSVVYDIKAANYINIAELLTARNFRNRFAEQLEILIPGEIKAEEIQTVTLYSRKKAAKNSEENSDENYNIKSISRSSLVTI